MRHGRKRGDVNMGRWLTLRKTSGPKQVVWHCRKQLELGVTVSLDPVTTDSSFRKTAIAATRVIKGQYYALH